MALGRGRLLQASSDAGDLLQGVPPLVEHHAQAEPQLGIQLQAAQGLDRLAQLLALDLDVAADLGRAAAGGAGGGPCDRLAGAADVDVPAAVAQVCLSNGVVSPSRV